MQLGTALLQITRLFNEGTVAALSDDRLLDRFITRRDDVAFAVLVERHGPMVLATCRAVLKDDHDAEDAFQATFLILARKARSVWGQATLGSWLHRVAYRVALQADAANRLRQRRERSAGTRRSDVIRHPPDDGLRAALHAEIERLPERYRRPIVLCDLEGLTLGQAALQLNWTVGSLRGRLARARQMLRVRLTRHGWAPSAVMITPILAHEASAAVSQALVSATVRAASAFVVGSVTSGAISANASVWAQRALRSLLWTQMKTVTTAAFVLGALTWVAAGQVALGTVGKDLSETPAPASPPPQSPAPKTAAADQPEESVAIRGRVVDSRGNPVAGASVRPSHLKMDAYLIPDVKSDEDGRFVLHVPQSFLGAAKVNGYEDVSPWVVASAPGFAPGWTKAALRRLAASDEFTITLKPDGPPIEGRILDLEGRPVAGAQVLVRYLRISESGSIAAWIAQVRDRGTMPMTSDGLTSIPVKLTTTTGPDGWFRLAGVGTEVVVNVLVSGPTIATTSIPVMTRDGVDLRSVSQEWPQPQPILIHSRRFEHAVAPTKLIEGVVRDKDTGRPIAGVTLTGLLDDFSRPVARTEVTATTDEQGRYRLVGLPKAKAYRLRLDAAQGQHYVRAAFRVKDNARGLEPVAFDCTLKRGIVLRGRVTDKVTGKPLPGYVHSFVFRNNPAISDFPGYEDFNSFQSVHVKADGRYETIALPGRNLIACRTDMRRYRVAVGAETIPGYKPETGFETLPQSCTHWNYHIVAEIDIDPKAEEETLDLQADPGRTVTVNVVDPDGRPLGGTKVSGVADMGSSFHLYEQESPTIEVHSLDVAHPRRVVVLHPGRKLVGSVVLKGDEPGPVSLRLQPWGTVTGRVLDDDGRRHESVLLFSREGVDPKHPDSGGVLTGDSSGQTARPGSDGRFRAEGLIPGLKYGATAMKGGFMTVGEVFQDITVEPGEVKDLGDLKVIPPKRDNAN